MTEPRPPICDYEGSDYQERFWDRGDRGYEDGAEAAALRRLLPSTGRFLLEVGAGAGRNTPRYGGYKRIALLDYSLTQLQEAQRRLGRDERYLYVAADVYRLPFALGVFDTATMIRTFHHMAEPQAALSSVGEVLARDASLIMEYANKRNLKAILRWLVRAQRWDPFDPAPIEFAELNFNFHPKRVREWLSEAGFELERELAVSLFRLALLKRLVPSRALVALDSALQPSGRWLLLSPSVFLRARALGPPNSRQFDSFWRCPVCKSLQLDQNSEGLLCHNCGRKWPLRDGIYDFRGQLEEIV